MSNKYKRLEGLEEAIKEGFKHTNKARVEMSPEEEMIKEKAKRLSPASDKDVKKMEERLKGAEKDPEERPKFKKEDFADV